MCMLSLELKWSLEKVEFGPILKQISKVILQFLHTKGFDDFLFYIE